MSNVFVFILLYIFVSLAEFLSVIIMRTVFFGVRSGQYFVLLLVM